MKRILILFILLFIGISAFAVERLDFHRGYISDNANIITADDNRAIQEIIRELRTKTTSEIAVVTVTSLDGQTVESAAIEVGRRYRIGDKQANNGIVLLVAPKEHEARIEVATGIIDVITDKKATKIMNDDMVAYFKQNEYSKGIYRGVASLATLVADSKGVTLTTTTQAPERLRRDRFNDMGPLVLFLICFLIFTAFDRLRRRYYYDDDDDYYYRRRRRYRDNDDRGNFSGGGGFSGGHGSSGKW